MRDIDQLIAALQRRHPDLRAEQRPATQNEGVWLVSLPTTPIAVQLESSTGNCPFLIESSLNRERVSAATIGEAINMVSTMLGSGN
jgi:hypothetical protein